nr:MAG TPA: hypothetical protein [Microviridae sp.]
MCWKGFLCSDSIDIFKCYLTLYSLELHNKMLSL